MQDIISTIMLLLGSVLALLLSATLHYYRKGRDERDGLKYLTRAYALIRAFEIVFGIALATVAINQAINLYVWSRRFVEAIGYDPFLQSTLAGSCLLAGLIAYYARCRFRMYYGITEIAIGIVAAYRTLGVYDANMALQLSAGIYVIVRGLDNIERSLRTRPNFRRKWVALFGSPD